MPVQLIIVIILFCIIMSLKYCLQIDRYTFLFGMFELIESSSISSSRSSPLQSCKLTVVEKYKDNVQTHLVQRKKEKWVAFEITLIIVPKFVRVIPGIFMSTVII